jgi:hypothetical protein
MDTVCEEFKHAFDKPSVVEEPRPVVGGKEPLGSWGLTRERQSGRQGSERNYCINKTFGQRNRVNKGANVAIWGRLLLLTNHEGKLEDISPWILVR